MKLDKQSKARLAKTYNFAKWNKPASSAVLKGASVPATRVQGYDLFSTRKLNTGEAAALYHFLWSRSGESQPSVSTQVFEAGNPAKAGDLMLYLLGQFEGPPLEPTRASISEVAFSTRGHRLVVFRKQNLVVVVTNIGDKPVDLSDFAGSLSQALAQERAK